MISICTDILRGENSADVGFLSLAFLLELSALVGSEAMAALIVGLGLIVMMLVVIVFRKSLIRDCVIRVLWKKGGDEYA